MTTLRELLKDRRVVLAATGALVIVLVWLLAFFLPQGKQLSKYRAQEQQLQTQQSALEAQLAQLQATSKAVPKLLSMQAQLNGLIPSTPDIYNYITQMSDTAAATGVHLVSITPSTIGTPVTGTQLQSIPVTVATTGTYDNTLGFIKAVYGMPRLTVINSMTIAGGGPGTNRSTILNEGFTMTIYTSAKPTTPAAG